ncbi:type II toxin-antitoxin system HicA family toxin [Desulfoplanes sp.]
MIFRDLATEVFFAVASVRTTGDHFHFRHPEKPGTVTVPHPKKDIPLGRLKSIERQCGFPLR